MNEQQQILLDHYHSPHNFGEISNYTHHHKIQNLSCGDELEIFLRVDPQSLTITKVGFVGEGCSISIASASLLTLKIKGMKVEDVLKLDYDDILDMIGIPLTPARLKCAVLSLEAVKKAF